MFKKLHQLNVSANHRRGRESEDAVLEALDELQHEGEIAAAWKSNYYQDKNEGIDVIVQLTSGDEFPLQVKSSTSGAHYAQEKHPTIHCIVVFDSSKTGRRALKDDLIKILKR